MFPEGPEDGDDAKLNSYPSPRQTHDPDEPSALPDHVGVRRNEERDDRRRREKGQYPEGRENSESI